MVLLSGAFFQILRKVNNGRKSAIFILIELNFSPETAHFVLWYGDGLARFARYSGLIK